MKFNRFIKQMLQAPEPDDKGGGGGNDDLKKEVSELKSALANITELLTKKGKQNVKADDEDDQEDDDSDQDDDQDLRKKALKNRDQQNQNSQNSKDLEAALRFSLGSKDWLKTNGSLLPKTIEDLFAAAEKENYDSPVEKDSAIKSGIVQEFFSIEANVQLLTPGLRSQLEDYLKLTNRAKAEKARQAYDNIFEPAFAMLKQVKKAEQLKNGGFDQSDTEKAYKDKLLKLSNKHYLGVKD